TAAVKNREVLFAYRPSPPRGLRAQHESLDLAGRGLRQVGPELDPARIFERGEHRLDVILQRTRQRIAGLAMILKDDEGLRLDQPVAVEPGDHGTFEHVD